MKYIWLIFMLLYTHFVMAQEKKSFYSVSSAKLHYTHRHFPRQSADFSASSSVFKVVRANQKTLTLKIPKNITPYLIRLAQQKKPKLKTIDILFIEQALMAWKNRKSPTSNFEFDTRATGLGIKMIHEGKGKLAEADKKIVFQYVGRFQNGQIFDQSEKKEGHEAILGKGKLIKGLDKGLVGLKAGTKVLFKVPPELGYGNATYGKIPPKTTLYYEITILRVE